MVSNLDVTPNPRILQMLGEIAFEPWQCIAELIDNSLDAYLSATEHNPAWLSESGAEHYSIHIDLPSQHDYDSGLATVSVKDSGPGMTIEEVRNAVKAGFSGNDPLGKLGLFGMGFNIATARLGRLTQVRTSRAGDDAWLILRLDLDKMQLSGEFHAQVTNEPKQDLENHGTVVTIERLKPEFKGNLTSGMGRAAIKKQLSRTYSAILTNEPVQIRVADAEIMPWRHCVWSEDRKALLSSGREFPARMKIDHSLPQHYFCNVCWHWSDPITVKEDTCPACGAAGTVEKKSRRIYGWIGLQRYFDQNHFGLDLIRNGRVIEQLNKDFFLWEADGEREIEYPIDAKHWGGRIVGQIHIDFAQVDYQKTSFSKNRNEWKDILDTLRGSSPLRPKIAQDRGYQENTSPIARMFQVFRGGNQTGLRMLVPGKISNPLQGDNADAAAWAERFYKGEEEFFTDERWWERVMQAEVARRGAQPDDHPPDDPDEPPDPEDPFNEIENSDEPDDEESQDTSSHLQPDIELSQKYDFPDSRSPIAPIEVRVFRDTRRLRPKDLRNLPPLSIDTSQAPSRYSMQYHPDHPAFTEYAESPGDYILIEVAHWFSTRQGGGDWTAGKVYQLLKNEYQRSKKLDLRSLGQSATDLLGELKEHLAECNLRLSREEADSNLIRELTHDVMSTSGRIEELDELLTSGAWIERVSDGFLLPVVQRDPELIMEGRFFRTSYESIAIEEIKQETVDRILSCLKDAILIKKASERSANPDKALLLRADAALSYLASQRA